MFCLKGSLSVSIFRRIEKGRRVVESRGDLVG